MRGEDAGQDRVIVQVQKESAAAGRSVRTVRIVYVQRRINGVDAKSRDVSGDSEEISAGDREVALAIAVERVGPRLNIGHREFARHALNSYRVALIGGRFKIPVHEERPEPAVLIKSPPEHLIVRQGVSVALRHADDHISVVAVAGVKTPVARRGALRQHQARHTPHLTGDHEPPEGSPEPQESRRTDDETAPGPLEAVPEPEPRGASAI